LVDAEIDTRSIESTKQFGRCVVDNRRLVDYRGGPATPCHPPRHPPHFPPFSKAARSPPEPRMTLSRDMGGPQSPRADLRSPTHRHGPTHRAQHGQGSTCDRARYRFTHQFGRLVDSGSITVRAQFWSMRIVDSYRLFSIADALSRQGVSFTSPFTVFIKKKFWLSPKLIINVYLSLVTKQPPPP